MSIESAKAFMERVVNDEDFRKKMAEKLGWA
ncbi:MAG: Nif11-like leader peptide family natural product precursor [Desulfobulbaceae bacterium]|nr:Nif11-like leader peptide family natural product precursor [Desulfobulbaceae bacterium]